jgi:hypothetical protein
MLFKTNGNILGKKFVQIIHIFLLEKSDPDLDPTWPKSPGSDRRIRFLNTAGTGTVTVSVFNSACDMKFVPIPIFFFICRSGVDRGHHV